MNPQDELLDIIDTYLNNGMSEEERFAFEEKLSQDETLAAKVNEVRLTNEAIYYASLAELKQTIGKDIKNIRYKETFNWKKASYISIASLALVSGITAYLVTDTKNMDQANTEHTHSIIHKKDPGSIQQNTTPLIKEGAGIDEKKSDQEHTIEKQKITDVPQTGSSPIQKTIIPVEDNLNTNEKIKTADTGKNIQPNNPDATVKKIVAPEVVNKIICNKSFEINTEASCKQKETGSITITSDGAYAYTFLLDTKSITGSKGIFVNTPAGIHEILVTYGKECTYTKKVTVAEKWCAMNSAYSFNPDYNEKWIFSYETGASGTFTIFDRSGKDIYSNTFGSGNEEWNGNDRQGMPVEVGVYIAFINYSDGRKEKVELTIVR